MATITKIEHKTSQGVYAVFIDNKYCTRIEEDQFPSFNLHEGKAISCSALKKRIANGLPTLLSSIKDQMRCDRVKAVIESLLTGIVISQGSCNTLNIIAPPTGECIAQLVIYPAEFIRGETYWIPSAKLISSLPYQNTWIGMVSAPPYEKILFIQPGNHTYPVSDHTIQGMTQAYAEITEQSPGVLTVTEFASHLTAQFEELGQVNGLSK
jgi:hypothetical protein